MNKNPFVLTIMDGWGHNPNPADNAVAQAHTPNFDRLWAGFPHTLIRTDGPFVGLPEGQMGNSEVGHLNIGAGRVVKMDVTRIDDMIANGEIFSNDVLKTAMTHARSCRLHLIGLVSPGGVHSHTDHLYALLEMAARENVERVFVHVLTDGRDEPPEAGAEYVAALVRKMSELGVGQVATICGRYYAMDRDKRWPRIERAFRAMVLGEGRPAATPSRPSAIPTQAGRPTNSSSRSCWSANRANPSDASRTGTPSSFSTSVPIERARLPTPSTTPRSQASTVLWFPKTSTTSR